MTSVGRRPTLDELILALHAVERVEADMDALDPEKETFRVVLTFRRAQCPQDWQDGPKPSWLFEELKQELLDWRQQRIREEQWVSKEEQFGASIDTIMAHWHVELQKVVATPLENMLTRSQKKILSNTIMRLNELKERRTAGGVYSAAGERREKASKAWMEDEYEAPKREEEQRRQQQNRAWAEWFDARQAFKDSGKVWEDIFTGTFTGTGAGFTGQRQQDPQKPQSGNKLPWYRILGVPVNATKDQIRKAHRSLVALHQPRTSADAEDKARNAKMAEINTARDEGLGGL